MINFKDKAIILKRRKTFLKLICLGSGMSEATAELMASPDLYETMIECSAANDIMVAPFFASKTLDILCKYF